MVQKKIYYHDTDAIGIAYYGSYLKILEESRTEFFESKGISVRRFHKMCRYFVIKNLHIDYINHAIFGDIICCESILDNFTASKIFFTQKIFSKDILIAEAKVVLCIVNKDLKPVVISKKLKTLLEGKSEMPGWKEV